MKRRWLIAFFALIFGALIAGCAAPDAYSEVIARGVLRVGSAGDYQPMSYLNPDTGEYEGFDVALAEDLAASLGVKLEYVPTSWPSLLQDTLERKFDLALCGITITPERQKAALMSIGYLGNGKTILCRAGEEAKYPDLASLNRPEVVIMENPGGLNEKFVRQNLPNCTLIIHPKNAEIPGLIAAGRADVMVTEVMEAEFYAQRDPRLAAPLLKAPFTHGELGALLPPGAESLREKVNDFIEREKRSGRLAELEAIYLRGEGNLQILHLRGTWREMGEQYGKTMRGAMLRVLEYANLRATEASDRYLLPHGLPCGVDFLDDFFAGVSAGSGLTLQQLVRINGVEVAYGEDLVKYLGADAAGKCSALALYGEKSENGTMIYGRNYDWLPEFAKLGMILTYFHPVDSDLSFAVLNYPGCFYLCTGMNSAGVFIELNSGAFASSETRPGVLHNAWSLWEVLLRSRTAEAAVENLKTIPAFSAYIIGIADAQKSFSVEWSCRGACALSAPDATGFLAMTNHFVQPGWENLPIAKGGKLSSESRRCAMVKLAQDVPPRSATVDMMQKIISVPVESGGACWPGTLYQVVAVPEKREMYIRCRGRRAWRKFTF